MVYTTLVRQPFTESPTMNNAFALSTTDSTGISQEPLAERLLDSFPSGSYALSALLRLMDIVESTSVPTARWNAACNHACW